MARTTEARLTAAEKRRKALDLRLQGYSYQDIADTGLYVSKGSVHKAVAQGLKDIPREAAEQAREAEMGRLDMMQKAVMQQALAGDPMAVDRVLKVVEARSKLLGLYDLPSAEDPEATRAKDALTEFLKAAQQAVMPEEPA